MKLTTLSVLAVLMPMAAIAQQIKVTVNDEPVHFKTAQPMQKNGTVMVPLRGVFEKMGANVMYDSAKNMVIVTKGSDRIELPIGRMYAYKNNTRMTLTTPANIVRGTTMVPLRFVSESLDADVQWNSDSRTVAVTTQEVGAETAPRP